MDENLPVPTAPTAIATSSPAQRVPWTEALVIYLDTLSSSSTRQTYERHIRAALEAIGVEHLADVAGQVLVYLAGSGHVLHPKIDQDSPLFPSRQGFSELTTRVYQVVTQYARAAGVEGLAITPHSLHHTYAISQLRTDASPIVVQKLLGHANIQAFQKYLDHLERDDLKRWAWGPLSSQM